MAADYEFSDPQCMIIIVGMTMCPLHGVVFYFASSNGIELVSLSSVEGSPLFSRGFWCIEVYGEAIGTFRLVDISVLGACMRVLVNGRMNFCVHLTFKHRLSLFISTVFAMSN